LNGPHLAARIAQQKTVQGELRSANTDDARQAEVLRILLDAVLNLAEARRIAAEGGDIVRKLGKAGAGALGRKPRRVGAKFGASFDHGIQEKSRRRADVDGGILRQRRHVGLNLQIAIPPEAGQGE
jgi:hypothetical protein